MLSKRIIPCLDIKDGRTVKGVNFIGLRDDLTPEKVNLPRQSFPSVYIPDGYIDVLKSSVILNTGTLHGDKMLVFAL